MACLGQGGTKLSHLTLSSLADLPAKLAPKARLHGYTVETVTAVPDFDLVAVRLRHDRTKAEHLHIARKDPNNCFRSVSGYAVRTCDCHMTVM